MLTPMQAAPFVTVDWKVLKVWLGSLTTVSKHLCKIYWMLHWLINRVSTLQTLVIATGIYTIPCYWLRRCHTINFMRTHPVIVNNYMLACLHIEFTMTHINTIISCVCTTCNTQLLPWAPYLWAQQWHGFNHSMELHFQEWGPQVKYITTRILVLLQVTTSLPIVLTTEIEMGVTWRQCLWTLKHSIHVLVVLVIL